MKNCPNVVCRGVNFTHGATSSGAVFIYCIRCGLSGPHATCKEKAITAWDNLPRGGPSGRRELLDKIIHDEYHASRDLSYESLGLKYDCATSTIYRRIKRHANRRG